MAVKFKLVSSLAKVFPTKSLKEQSFSKASAIRGEVFSYQVAFKSDTRLDNIEIEIISNLKHYISVRVVKNVPVNYLGSVFDDNVLSKEPGLFPDLLTNYEQFRCAPFVWQSFWVTVRLPQELKIGNYTIALKIKNTTPWLESNNGEWTTPKFNLNVLDAQMTKNEIIFTNWFHADCIYDYYKTKVFSKRFWEYINKYFANMNEHGINMIFTPLFTPPLDTQVGGERPTIQLVDISEECGIYTFGFEKLKIWVDLAIKNGFKYLEFSQLFTQWGAEKCPKIIIKKGAKKRKCFGWNVDSTDSKYVNFVEQFAKALKGFIEQYSLKDMVYLHISDEPYMQHLEKYGKAHKLLHDNFESYKFIDAMSNSDFFTQGLIEIPVVCSNNIEKFMSLDIKERWIYYCTSQNRDVSNQFIHYPSSRNRIMGLLMYIYDIKGFLHWGYNFWYAQFSKYSIDPYKVTDAAMGFQGGDAFKVYPGEDGPEDSIRHEVFFEAIQDYNILRALERKISRPKVLEFIAKNSPMKLQMDSYPKDAEFLLELREKINQTFSNNI